MNTCPSDCTSGLMVFAGAFSVFLFLIATWYGDHTKLCRCPNPAKCPHRPKR